MNNKVITVKVQSAGLSYSDPTFITLNDTEFGFEKYSRGFNVAVINETTGQKICCTTFDPYTEGNSEAFVQFVENLPEGRIVAIAVHDDASYNLSDQVKAACKSLGSLKIYSLRFRSSWAMIGQKGAKPTKAKEELSDYCAVSCWRPFTFPSVSENGACIAVKSSSGDDGTIAEISLNGESIGIEGGYQRGLNLVVFDPSNGNSIFSQSFDLFADPTAADTFAQRIEELPDGKMVAIAVQDDASINLSDRAKQACESIGSSLIRYLQFRSSWAIVGHKGASPGSAIEQLSNTESAAVKFWLT